VSVNPEKFVVSGNGVKVGVDVVRARARANSCPANPILLSAGNGPFECNVYVDSTRARRLAEMLVAAADRVDGEP